MMRGDRLSRILSIAALAVAVAAALMAGHALMLERDRQRQVEGLGELIRRSSAAGRPVMDMGPPGGHLPELDPGE